MAISFFSYKSKGFVTERLGFLQSIDVIIRYSVVVEDISRYLCGKATSTCSTESLEWLYSS